MPSIHDIVDLINESITLEDAMLFGIAQTIQTEEEKRPAVAHASGEGEYVGIDDEDAIRIYHKVNAMVISVRPKESYGRNGNGTLVNAYSMSMIVFQNRSRTHKHADELVQMIEALVPGTLKLAPYREINIVFNSVILNDLQVYGQEYQLSTFRLGPEHNLFQINYTVEVAFLKGCFNNTEQ